MKNLNDAVVPFLWVRNEDFELIKREIDAIKALSINAFMIESRPRVLSESDFGTESWYARVGKILAYAQKLNMRVWLLDDRSFPTGSANGKMNLKYPHLRAKQIKCVAIDLALKCEPSFVLTGAKEGSNDRVIYGCLKGQTDFIDFELKGDEKIVDLPLLKGLYRAYFLIETEDSAERDGYIDMLNPESVGVLIKEVYEPHYERFSEYFGTTFMGYFSDEPRFCNGINWYHSTPVLMNGYNVGKINLAYPYSEKVLNALKEKGYSKRDLLSIFTDINDNYSDFRADYMDVITDEYSKNFVGGLSNWCASHGVKYAGHVIEDIGVHFTSGCSCGHYFKAMRTADFAGIDVVLHQIKPFYTDLDSISPIDGGVAECDFFNFTLAKLASSVAVQSEYAESKSLCEIFGAYGWGETLSDMLYLVNHMAVRGINHFIPHAFSMNLYDKDCPPYFFGQGRNPSFDGFKKLFEYMQFLSAYSYKSYAKVALFYNAESVWSGREYLSIDKVARVLTENQIEFDFIDKDNLVKASHKDGKIKIRDCEYDCLIMPKGYLRKETEEILSKILAKVIFVDQDGLKSLEDLPTEYKFERKDKSLRVKKINDTDFMFFNESLDKIENWLYTDKKLYLINPITKKAIAESKGDRLNIKLNSAQALFAVTKIPEGYEWEDNFKVVGKIKICDVYAKHFEKDDYNYLGKKDITYTPLIDNPSFSGSVSYVFDFNSNGEQYLSVDFYGEFVKVEVNDKAEDFILSPGTIKLDGGKNKIRISVCNTLANAMKDFLSVYAGVSSCGIKNITIKVKE